MFQEYNFKLTNNIENVNCMDEMRNTNCIMIETCTINMPNCLFYVHKRHRENNIQIFLSTIGKLHLAKTKDILFMCNCAHTPQNGMSYMLIPKQQSEVTKECTQNVRKQIPPYGMESTIRNEVQGTNQMKKRDQIWTQIGSRQAFGKRVIFVNRFCCAYLGQNYKQP